MAGLGQASRQPLLSMERCLGMTERPCGDAGNASTAKQREPVEMSARTQGSRCVNAYAKEVQAEARGGSTECALHSTDSTSYSKRSICDSNVRFYDIIHIVVALLNVQL